MTSKHITPVDSKPGILKESKYDLNVAKPINVDNTKQVIDDAKDVFTGIGCLKNYECDITTNPLVSPVVAPARRYPEKVKVQLEKQLKEMEKDGIICKQNDATPWVSSLVCAVKQNGSLRICLDPKPLNKAIIRPHHPTPTLDETLTSLAKCKYFSTLDQSSGYWNIKVKDDCIPLLTFNSPWGRWSYRRLPFGLNLSQDIFQRAIE